jgi:hypothetical protein
VEAVEPLEMILVITGLILVDLLVVLVAEVMAMVMESLPQ